MRHCHCGSWRSFRAILVAQVQVAIGGIVGRQRSSVGGGSGGSDARQRLSPRRSSTHKLARYDQEEIRGAGAKTASGTQMQPSQRAYLAVRGCGQQPLVT